MDVASTHVHRRLSELIRGMQTKGRRNRRGSEQCGAGRAREFGGMLAGLHPGTATAATSTSKRYPVKRMTERRELGPIEPMFGLLAARAIEVLVTHNEAVNCDDLACALGVTDAEAWTVATRLRALGYATLDERQA